jgi:hypothetical protein
MWRLNARNRAPQSDGALESPRPAGRAAARR